MSKNILVTGAAGFLGSHLCDRLLSAGHEVTGLDNLYSGNLRNIEHLSDNSRFRFVHHDIEDRYQSSAVIDEIYNLACPASPVMYQRDPIKTMHTNVIGAINMLDLAREKNARIFQASTSEVYGDPEQHPQMESYWGHVNPVGIRSCYDEGKRCAETLFFDYQRQYGLPIKVVRIFNTYGPRMQPDDGRVVSNFISQALAGEPLTVYGEGQQTRSFCYVDDLVEGFVRMMESDEAFAGPVNLGNPSELNMLELAERVIEETGSDSELSFVPLPSDDPKQRRPDISLAAAQLDWRPQVALAEGLKKTVAYFKETLNR